MPKLKTHRGAAKRFKKTGTGKIVRAERIQAPHPDEQDHEIEATDAWHQGSGPSGRAQAAADAAV